MDYPSNTDSGWTALQIIGVLLLIPIVFYVGGWGFSLMWSWFVVPLGVPAISIPHAIGLNMFVLLLKTDTTDKDNPATHRIFTSVFVFAFVLFAAWVVSGMM